VERGLENAARYGIGYWIIKLQKTTAQIGRHPHAVNVCSFLSEVLNVQPTTSTVLTFGPGHRAAASGRDPCGVVTIPYALASLFLALIAGILILIGLIGIFGR
jgi:hypothetical protein